MRWLLLLALLCALPARARDVLVTVDDVPFMADGFDQAARAAATDQMLAILQKHGIKAIAFVTLSRRQTPADDALIRRWRDAGHVIGNHGDQHLSYTHVPMAEWLADVERARVGIEQIVGAPVRHFRFPFLREGHTAAHLDAARDWLKRTGQRAVPVTLNLQDYRYEARWQEAKTPAERAEATAEYQEEMRRTILAETRIGDALVNDATPQILLLHAMVVSAAQWDALFTWMKQAGYRFAAPDAVLGHPHLNRPHRYIAPYGTSYWLRLKAEQALQMTTASVLDLLDTQVKAWNRGDLAAFCSVYAEDALFISPKGLTRGRAAVEARYRSRYPNKAAMGELSLEIVETRAAQGSEFTAEGGARPSRVHGLAVAARWTLRFPDKPVASGQTLIIFRRVGDEWKIVQDASM